MFTKAIRTRSLTALAAALTAATVFQSTLLLADQPTSGLKPVPPMRSVPKPLSGETSAPTAASKKLSWRPSEKVAPEQPPASSTTSLSASHADPQHQQLMIPAVNASQTAMQSGVQQHGSQQQQSLGEMFASSPSPRQQRNHNVASASGSVTQQPTTLPRAASGPAASGESYAVAQVAYTQDRSETGAGGFYVPGSGDGAFPPRVATQPPSDPFKDPFGDRNGNAVPNAGRLIVQPQDQGTDNGLVVPPLTQDGGLQVPSLEQTDDLAPIDSPSDQPGTDLNAPQGLTPPSFSAPDMDTETEEAEEAGEADLGPIRNRRQSTDNVSDGASEGTFGESKNKLGQYATTSCDDLRKRLASRTIRDVSLDISPPFRPDILEKDTYKERFDEFQEAQLPRAWRNVNGELLTQGKFVGLEFEHAIIAQEDGQEVEILLQRLSEPDLAYITEQWGLPQECQMPNIAFQPREWLPMTMTWKASALCHKPLYFEEVALERYGHTTGPFAQPIISTAHFFVNIAVLPYKMGIHPPSECQYALGYYRPGNCAPWIIPPVPLSLRGALFQAGAIGAGVALIP